MPYTLRAIQKAVGGELSGNADELIVGVNALEGARAGEVTFADADRYVPQTRLTHASAIIVSKQFPPVDGKNLLRVANPRLVFIKVMEMFRVPEIIPHTAHPSAVIAPEAILGHGVTVSECAVIRPRARIGRDTIIESGVHVGAEVTIGEDCAIGPNVVLMAGTRLGNRVVIHGGSVIGGDGFGYVWADGHHVKVPQLGHVVIEDDVEIGCNVCVDRATFGVTVIRRGVKIDNLVQIAHNDIIGEDVIIAGQVGLSGSVTVGDRAMFGGQSGVIDHITIGHDARIGAATPVTKEVKPGESVWGFPARPLQHAKRELASLALLPQLLRRFRDVMLRLARVESRLERLEHPKRNVSQP